MSRQKTTAPRLVMRMRQLRRSRELTQKQLGDRVGVEASVITSYERGRMKPSVDNAIKLATELGCHVEELFEQVEVPQ